MIKTPVNVKSRKLADLYKLGKPFTATGPEGSVEVYLQKLNPVETETAVRKANAARAKFLVERHDKQSDVYLNALNEIVDYTDDNLLEYLVSDELARRSQVIEAEWASTEGSRWADEEYLQGIWDAWNEPGVQESFFVEEGEEPDPDAQKLFETMSEYSEELTEELGKQREYIKKEFSHFSRAKLEEQMVDRITKMQSDLVWMIEYRKCELWLGVLNSESDRTHAFENRAAVDELSEEILSDLIEAFSDLTVEVDEGKDSQSTEDSSPPSEPQESVAGDQDSSSPEE